MKYPRHYLLAFFFLFIGLQKSHSQTDSSADPFLWLEEVESEKSLDWVRAQNKISENILTKNDLFEPLKQKYLAALNDKDKIPYPTLVGDFVYNLWKDDVNERGLWRRMLLADYTSGSEVWEVVLDLDILSKKEGKKWIFSGASWLEPEKEICLLYLSDGGSDKDYLREFNAKTKEFVEGGFNHGESKGGATWQDANTLLISRDFGPGTLTTSGYARTIKKWKRGTDLDQAETIFEGDSTDISSSTFSHYLDGVNNLFVQRGLTFYKSEYDYYVNGEFKKLSVPVDAELHGVFKNELIVFLQSDWTVGKETFPSGALVSFNYLEDVKGKLKVKSIYQPNAKSSFVGMSISKDFIVINCLENIQNQLLKYRLEKNEWKSETVDAPDFGSIYLITSSDQTNDFFFVYSNFITPYTLYYALDQNLAVVKKSKEIFENKNLEVHQYSAKSKDGTMIPYFIVHPVGMKLDGTNPTLVYAYGGFNVSMQPNYSYRSGLGWLEQGGVYVLANIRGGGEFGPNWHQAALKENRQIAFDDLYAVSEDVINKKISSPANMGVMGGSNGGLLVGVAFTQRPDLYNAVVCAVPLLDMKRYSKLLAGASWMAEFGNPDIPEEWEYISKYSPYQNVSATNKYPEVYFTTSTKDDRVHPGHARKMAAKMMNMGHPILYYETIEGGHGGSSTNAQRAYLWASIYTYLNMKLKPPLDEE